jgi:uncharacterized protein (DUF2336 family)
MPDVPGDQKPLGELSAKLQSGASTALRRETAARLGDELSAGRLNAREQELALSSLAALAHDVEVAVRQAVAEHVLSCAVLPRPLALKLATDVEQVAVSFLAVSPALLDDDLLGMLTQAGAAKQIAIAKRPNVSEPLADGLIDTGIAQVVSTLLENPGARLSEPSLHKVIDRFPGDEAIQALLANRPTLPLTVTDRLIRTVSKAMRVYLMERHGLPWDFAHEIVKLASESTLVDRLVEAPSVPEVEQLAAVLHQRNKLTPTLLLRALCMGDSHFFAAGLAARAGIPIERVISLIGDPSAHGFKALHARAGLPPDLLRAFRIALDTVKEVKEQRRASWRREHTELLIDRLMQAHYSACPEVLERLMSRVSIAVLGQPLRTFRPA